MKQWVRLTGRVRRQRIIRKKVSGTGQKPRVSIYRSLKNVYAQVIDDMEGKTLVSVSTALPEFKEKLKKDAGNVKGASALGAALADLCRKKGITKVVFDRSGYLYHGRVKAVAEAARKGGLEF